MIYPKSLLEKIEEARIYVDQWIHAAEAQGAINYEALYSLQKGLNEFYGIVKDNEDLNIGFINNWNNLWKWVPRFFDGDPFLDLFNEIDKYVPTQK